MLRYFTPLFVRRVELLSPVPRRDVLWSGARRVGPEGARVISGILCTATRLMWFGGRVVSPRTVPFRCVALRTGATTPSFNYPPPGRPTPPFTANDDDAAGGQGSPDHPSGQRCTNIIRTRTHMRWGARAHYYRYLSRRPTATRRRWQASSSTASSSSGSVGRRLCNSARVQRKRKLRQNARLFRPPPTGHTTRTRHTDTRVSGP